MLTDVTPANAEIARLVFRFPCLAATLWINANSRYWKLMFWYNVLNLKSNLHCQKIWLDTGWRSEESSLIYSRVKIETKALKFTVNLFKSSEIGFVSLFFLKMTICPLILQNISHPLSSAHSARPSLSSAILQQNVGTLNLQQTEGARVLCFIMQLGPTVK